MLRDSILGIACIYAAIDAIHAILEGGRDVEYGLAALWAGILCCIGLVMTLYLYRRAKKLQSPMLELDARSWLLSACLSLALLIGFAIAIALEGTEWESWVPYLDAISLLIMSLIMLPMPLLGLWRSMTDVLQVAPHQMDHRVHDLMDRMVKERGFLDYSSYVAKVGRGGFVEIHILVSPNSTINTALADGIRREIAARLEAASHHLWLTVDFTSDREWL